MLIVSSYSDTIPLEQTITIITVYQQKIDSVDNVIHKEQVKLLKDPIFNKCRKSFFDETFQDQISFIKMLNQYKTNQFIASTFENLIKIKELEKEQLEYLLLCEPDTSNDRAIIRLHIRKTQDQIHQIFKAIINNGPVEDIKIERLPQSKLVFE